MLRVLALTGGYTIPSARYRIRHLSPWLLAHRVAISESYPTVSAYPPHLHILRPAWLTAAILSRLADSLRSYHYDLTLIQRELISTLPSVEPITKRPRVFDVDDAIYLHRNGLAARTIAKHSDLVICGNEYLAARFAAWNNNIAVLPTAVDTTIYKPALRLNINTLPQIIRIGWMGTSGNIRYLLPIVPALSQIFKQYPNCHLRIVSDHYPDSVVKALGTKQRVEFSLWSAASEVTELQTMDIGIMPLHDGEWERGKCSFKLLQYMACGLPVVASPVGMNKQVLNMGSGQVGFAAISVDDWIQALATLLVNNQQRCQYGTFGRQVVLKYFDTKLIATRLAQLLNSVC